MFIKEPERLENIVYKSPLGKSDHVLIEFKLKGGPEEARRKDYKEGRYKYSKKKFTELRRHFKQADWTTFHKTEKTKDKWRILLEKYNKE